LGAEREVVLSMPTPIVAARHIRSTVLLSSVAAVRSAGFGDAYMKALDPQHRSFIEGSVVGMWVPMETAVAHYRACDSLGMSNDTAVSLGRSVFDRTAGTLLGTVVKLSKASGVTPWTILPLFQRFWGRGFDGGGIAVYKLGPKDAQIDAVAIPVNDVRYFRHALRGLVMGVLDMFSAKTYVRELVGIKRDDGAAHLRVQWA
jgi:hypothetical protein